MKFYLCTLLFLCCAFTTVFAGEFHSDVLQKGSDGQWTYEKVIPVDNISKEALYKKMKAWVLSNIKTGDNNILTDDKDFETINTTPTIKLENLKNRHLHDQLVNFKLTIYFKDNKIKIVANTFYYYGLGMTNTEYRGPFESLEIKRIVPSPYNALQEKFDEAFTAFVVAVENAATAKDTKKSDW